MMSLPIWVFVTICILAFPITLLFVFMFGGIILGLMIKLIKLITNIFKGVWTNERELNSNENE